MIAVSATHQRFFKKVEDYEDQISGVRHAMHA
jgi:hypothetical protein